jgi:hypothetical protein
VNVRRLALSSLSLVLPLAFWASCSVYDESLLEPEETSSTTTSDATTTTSAGQGGGGGAGAGATTTATTTASGQGGEGGQPDCQSPSDCPGTDDDCQARTCNGGVCGMDYAAAGTDLAQQTDGDCQIAECDGSGGVVETEDPTDPDDDGLDCTVDACSGTTTTHTPLDPGSPCSQGGGSLCNAAGACVECVVNGDCATNVCDATFHCALASCGDAVKNGTETDVDCGGMDCAPCPTGKLCAAGTDCVGGSCTGGICVPTCTDQTKNNGESDVDCGGPNCADCAVGKACVSGADCVDGVCTAMVCVAASCSDGVKNGTETAVDCGGGTCDGCPTNHLILNEVEYDEVGTDSDEFVEIYNNTGAPVSLANYTLVLVNGSNNATYKVVSLAPAGTLADKQYLVVGSATVVAAQGALKIDFSAATNNVENGSPDGVALVDTSAGVVVDALSYEGAMTTANVTGVAGTVSLVEGNALPNNVADSNTKVGSLCRLPNATDTNDAATDWAFSNNPTPGVANVP